MSTSLSEVGNALKSRFEMFAGLKQKKNISYNKMEDSCLYVSSRGIIKSCTIFQSDIRSGNPNIQENLLKHVCDGDSVYICTAALPNFVKSYMRNLTKRIVLVSGDSVESITAVNEAVCAAILECPYIVKWFAQNNHVTHSKLIHLPLGMDYHTMSVSNSSWGPKKSPYEQELDIRALVKDSLPFYKRQHKCYTTFHFELHRGDRREAYDKIPKDLVYYEPTRVSRNVSHMKQMLYAFVISPYGGGTDCHRTWEALILGCIPIIKSSKMDPLFDGLPVLLVKKWSDVTQELLDETVKDFQTKTFQYEKLTLEYWKTRISKSMTAPVPSITP